MAVAVPAAEAVVRTPEAAGRGRLAYLDGMRGLAALYVAFTHIGVALGIPARWMTYVRLLPPPSFAVAVFIVLSGFCLMLPVVQSGDGRIPGGTAAFFKRRARRILPPYYAAMAVACLFAGIQVIFGGVQGGAKLWWSENLSPGSLLSHALLFHNLSPAWHLTINPAFWSIATEFQIYLLFPYLLLPLWRRAGALPVIALGLALGAAPHFLLPAGRNLDTARFWYVGLFAMGMAGAATAFSGEERMRLIRERAPWGWLFLALAGVAAWLDWRGVSPALDAVVGEAAVCLILHCARGSRSLARAALQWRPVAAMGTFSYSLYLLHWPAWWILSPILKDLGLSAAAATTATVVVGLPFAIGLSYFFYQSVERPCMPPRGRTGQAQKLSAGAASEG